MLRGWYSGKEIWLLDFIGKDFLKIDLYLVFSAEGEDGKHNNRSDLLCLSRFILKEGTETSDKDEYELDLAEHHNNSELSEILNSLGICDFLWDLYHDVLATVEKVVGANYNIRLDRYHYDPEARIFALEK